MSTEGGTTARVVVEGPQYVEARFLSGTWHTIYIPVDKVNDPAYDLETLYDGYWNDGVPDDVQVTEDELDHIWE